MDPHVKCPASLSSEMMGTRLHYSARVSLWYSIRGMGRSDTVVFYWEQKLFSIWLRAADTHADICIIKETSGAAAYFVGLLCTTIPGCNDTPPITMGMCYWWLITNTALTSCGRMNNLFKSSRDETFCAAHQVCGNYRLVSKSCRLLANFCRLFILLNGKDIKYCDEIQYDFALRNIPDGSKNTFLLYLNLLE